MNRFVHETKVLHGNTPYSQWVPERLKDAKWAETSYKVEVSLPRLKTDKQDQKQVRSISSVGILVTDLFRPRGASENSWQGTPVEFVDYDMSMVSRFLKTKPYPQVPLVGEEYKSVIVPLGFPANKAAWDLVKQNLCYNCN